jgi:lysophospholipase L1-like esterase
MRSHGVSQRMMVAVALVITFSAAISIAALSIARSFYLERQSLRIAPVNIDRFARENAALGPSTVPRVILFGDSRVAYWLPAPSIPGFEIVFRGIAGETTAQMRYRFQQDVIALQPRVVIIQAGINDLVAASLLPGADDVAAATMANLRHFALAARSAGSEVILMTIVRPAQPPIWRWPVWSGSVLELVARVNNMIIAAEMESSIRVLDADGILGDNSEYLPRRYAAGTLHFSEPGYQVLNGVVQQMVSGLAPCRVQ